MARFYCIWNPNYGLIAEPLCEALRGEEREPFQWNREREIKEKERKKESRSVVSDSLRPHGL